MIFSFALIVWSICASLYHALELRARLMGPK